MDFEVIEHEYFKCLNDTCHLFESGRGRFVNWSIKGVNKFLICRYCRKRMKKVSREEAHKNDNQ